MPGLAGEDDFNERTELFMTWLKSKGVSVSPKIEIADLRQRSAGRGVLASQDIDEDEELFSIPRTSILSTDTSGLSSDIVGQLEDPWLSLILAMIYESRHGAQSTWKAYLDVLPEDFDTLMYWSADELSALQGSAVVKKIGKVSADNTFTEQLIPIMKQHADTFNVVQLSDDHLCALCHRMGSTIMAYAFDLEKATNSSTEEDGWEEDSDAGDGLPKGMVPLADILNADADLNNAKLFYEDDKVVMKTIKAVKQGEELLNDYGPLPRADVLRRYGYVTGNYAQYDVVEISLKMIRETFQEQSRLQEQDLNTRLQYLDEEGLLEDGYDTGRKASETEQFGEELCVLLNTLAMSTADFEKLSKKEKLPKPDLAAEALKVLYTILVNRQAAYPTDTDDHVPDIDSLAIHANMNHRERRCAMAADVIAGEREVLHEAVQAVQEALNATKKRKVDDIEDEERHAQKPSKVQKANHGG